MNTEPRKLSVLLELCLHIKPTTGGLRYGLCAIADDLNDRGHISLEEMWLVQDECMKLVGETRLNPACLLHTALLQRLRCHRRYLEDMCYLIYSCWIDKLESEGK